MVLLGAVRQVGAKMILPAPLSLPVWPGLLVKYKAVILKDLILPFSTYPGMVFSRYVQLICTGAELSLHLKLQ